MPIEQGTTMQRIRIGLTGLAFVFLLVMLGTAISRSTENSAAPANNANANASEPNEPLAELGVAPGDSGTNNAAHSAGNNSANPAR